MACLSATLKLALDLLSTSFPVLFVLLICEGGWTLVTLELRTVEGLHDESIDLGAQVNLYPTVGAGVVLAAPLTQTFLTAKLVAVEALLRCLDDLQANCAGEVLVDFTLAVLAL